MSRKEHDVKKMAKALTTRWRGLAGPLIALCCMAAAVETASFVPNVFNPNESQFQNETHFLAFSGEHDAAGENVETATAYYNAIDPTGSKRTFQEWLVKAGFIGDVSQWHPTGPQEIACDLPGCDHPRGTYGDNIINTDAHAIVLNAADLGFVRNQFIRCVPSCTAANPIIYSYLENYPVNPFASFANGGSGFPVKTGYPTEAEAAAAIQSALNRPFGNLPGCTSADTALGCSIQRIADVAFEWAPPPNNPTSSARYGQLYAFVFSADSSGNTSETISFPGAGGVTPNIATGVLEPFSNGDPFPPNLDFLGFKQHPGVCFVCHGGEPKNLTLTGAYPQQGRVNGFRFLPLDVRSLLFTSDSGSEPTSRLSQEPQMKLYNQAVLKTVSSRRQIDGQGATRAAHLREVIVGWYAGFPGDQTMSGSVQEDFIPVGWRESLGAAPGSEELYATVVGPSCRACHFNRELDLDFGTVRSFDTFRDAILELVLMPLCNANKPPRGEQPMPLAHLTYQRFWEANANPKSLPSGHGGPVILQNTAEQIAQHFGFSGTAAFCASKH
jgi:hypothetical protein